MEHPRIVPVYDAGETDGRAFMSMRFVAGDSLAERIARGGPLPATQAIAMLTDIGAALDFAHARGTIHRDVKPANILLDPDGTSYLGDFGLVRMDDMPGLTRRGDWLGTAEYVSPEQVEGEQATAASDLYGLAAVAFEALTGRAPFVRREPSAVLLAHVREPVPDASAIAPGAHRSPSTPRWRAASRRTPTTASPTPTASWRAAPRPRQRRAAPDPRRRARRGGAAAGAAGGDPWDAALSRFSETGGAPPGDRPTQAFGDAKIRRRRFAWGRDAAIAAAVAGVLLLLGAGLSGAGRSATPTPTPPAPRRAATRAARPRAARRAGKKQGRTSASPPARRPARRRARPRAARSGSPPARRRASRRASRPATAPASATGAASALSGLSPGARYIVRVGSDESGAVVSQSQGVPNDASTCFAVSGDTVLSGSC